MLRRRVPSGHLARLCARADHLHHRDADAALLCPLAPVSITCPVACATTFPAPLLLTTLVLFDKSLDCCHMDCDLVTLLESCSEDDCSPVGCTGTLRRSGSPTWPTASCGGPSSRPGGARSSRACAAAARAWHALSLFRKPGPWSWACCYMDAALLRMMCLLQACALPSCKVWRARQVPLMASEWARPH